MSVVTLPARPRPRLTIGPIVARFFERRLRFVQGPLAGRPFVLEPWQREDLDLIYEVDERGRRRWQTVLWGQARGNGKTPIVGGAGLLELNAYDDAPRVFCASGAKDQAKLLLEFAKPTVEQGPLRDHLIVRANSILRPRVGGVMRILSADGDLQHGLNVSFAGIDELHVFKTQKQRELYFALTTALKRPNSWEMSITTAGWSKHDLLGQRYDAMLRTSDVWISDDGCLIIARDHEAGQLMIWRGLPEDADPGDESLWRAVNPASWVDLVYLRRQAHRLPAAVFRRLHLNQWTEAENSAIAPPQWDACRDPVAAVFDGAEEVFLGATLSARGDSGAVCLLARREERAWPVRLVLFEHPEGLSCAEQVLEHIRQVVAERRIRDFAFSRSHFGRGADSLYDQGVPLYRPPGAAPGSEPGWSWADAHMIPASQALVDRIAARGIAHDADRDARAQVLAGEATLIRDAWRMARPKRYGEEDPPRTEAAFALLMAHAAAEAGGGGEPWAAVW